MSDPSPKIPEAVNRAIAEAIQRQRIVRSAAFFPITETVAGYELLPMTVAHYSLLVIAGNPLLYGGTPSPVQLAQFLLILAPDCQPGCADGFRRRFLRRCRKDFIPSATAQPFFFKQRKLAKNFRKMARAAEIISSIRGYVTEMMTDRPVKYAGGSQEEICCDAAWFCAVLGREYGYGRDFVLTMPIKQVFQFVNEIVTHHNPKAGINRVGTQIRGKYLDELQAEFLAGQKEAAK